MTDRLDLLLLGATGFTGIHCIPYLHKFSKSSGRNMTWGVAGRSEEKLKQALEKIGKEIEADLEKIPTIVVDINDEESLLKMAQRAKVVINCCGPFFPTLGEAVVKACIAAGTHHVDVSGEPQYMEKVQLEQNVAAKEKGVYVVSACGLDSIPADLGIVFLQQEFEGTLNSVVTYMEAWEEGSRSTPGSAVNYGTWHSAVTSLGHWNDLVELRKKLFPKKLPKFEPQLKHKVMPHKSNVVDGWVVPFPGSDRSVIKRSQLYFYEVDQRRPVQVGTYFVVKSLMGLILLAIFGTIFSLFTKFSFGRKLLLNYPEIFSGGYFSKKSPPEEKIQKSWFQITLYGEGWKEKLTDKDDQYPKPCDKCIVGRVKGNNPGYGATCVCLVLSAIVIATENDKLPGKGGVLAPGAAFAKTSLVKQLNENGVTFDVISQKDL
ncbi:saccharopine dehydrogenase-like oxidoreductase [Anoplophora glabripennis]|uniref:saccharopine dehydrogenase-like oxidoreductase n=1 Tax=Anoplophora glabripennis TaxID=217634 RepID=UPI000873E7A5|nr:saccharopine dehydrogenase-like oxidoreductase [Anoplophora glabripennis]XP_018580217.1 saccharopine dehydrogenase-like oxidoreductase [Anoplophora glabripennis]XP_018580218.1 saccharopine dehydrogenase-like oxidoreductase [Anoplophora glabripennis]